jgi:hypothetical protein
MYLNCKITKVCLVVFSWMERNERGKKIQKSINEIWTKRGKKIRKLANEFGLTLIQIH